MTTHNPLIIITTPYWVLFTQWHQSREEFYKKLDSIQTIERFHDLERFFDRLSILNPKVALHSRYFEQWADNSNDTLYCMVNFADEVYFHPIKRCFFDDEEGALVFWSNGDFELVKKDGQYVLALSQYVYAKDWTSKSLNGEEIEGFLQEGIPYIKQLLPKIRLEHWHHQPIWIVFVKANVDNKVMCSMAFDDSDFFVKYICVPADSSEEALNKAIDHLKADYMSLARLYEIKPYVAVEKGNQTGLDLKLATSVAFAFERQCISWYGALPYHITSFLITPYATILSKWHCDQDYWSTCVETIVYNEFFFDKESCFKRLLDLQQLKEEDYDAFNELKDFEDEPVHYRIRPKGSTRFEKIQRTFNASKDLMIDWEDWNYDFYRQGEDYYLWVYLGGIADRTKQFKLSEDQVNHYRNTGIEYIRDLARQTN